MEPLVRGGFIAGLAGGSYSKGVVDKLNGAAGGLFGIAFPEAVREIQQALEPTGTADQKVTQMSAERRYEILGIETLCENFVEGQKRSSIVSRKGSVYYLEAVFVVEDVEILQDVFVLDVCSAEGNGLVEDGQGVAHSAVCLTGYYVERFVFYVNPFFSGHHPEVGDYVRYADAVEIVGLAAGKDSREDLVFLRRTQDEDRVCRRFLERLQEGVEGRLREHVDLIDDVDAILTYLRGNLDLIHQGFYVVYAVVRRGVQLADAVGPTLRKRKAGLALAARLHVGRRIRAVDRFREDSRGRGLSDSAGTAEKIGMGQLTPDDGVLKGSGDIVLTDERPEGVRTVLSG